MIMTNRIDARSILFPSCILLLTAGVLACANGGGGHESIENESNLQEAQQSILQNQNVFDVTSYGASPADFNDDTLPIQAAIDAAAANGGGTVYFPQGEYDVSESLTLPRSSTAPLVLQGEGRLLTRITTEANHLAPSEPVIKFSGNETAKDYVFRDLMIGRLNNGAVFHHDQPTPTTFLWRAVFERVFFAGPDDPDGAAGAVASADLVHVQGAQFSVMDDVVFNGGNAALKLEESSHVELRRLSVDQKHQVNHGIVLVGGDNYSIHGSRIQAVDGGSALSIEGGSGGIRNVRVDGLSAGGARTAYAIQCLGSSAAPVSNVTMKNIDFLGVGGKFQGVFSPAYGIYVNPWVSDVRVVGANVGSWADNVTHNGGRVVVVAGGARNISIEGMLLADPVGNNGLGDYVWLQGGAQRVHVELFDGSHERWIRDEEMSESWTAMGTTAYVGAGETVEASTSSGSNITQLLQRKGAALLPTAPSKGQRIILLGSPAAPVLEEAGGGNLRLASQLFTLGPDSNIQMVYDGASWQEISRSQN